ncbi:MAG: hypothetical protein R3F14_26485 [Polyangiaceae bacterium]
MCQVAALNVPADRPTFSRRLGHAGAIGPYPTGGSACSRRTSMNPAGCSAGSGIIPNPSGAASSATPTGFHVPGPPAARSYRSGAFVMREP